MDSGSSRTAWYSNMSCNQCRRRVGLRPHDELAKNKSLELHEANMAHAVSGGAVTGEAIAHPLHPCKGAGLHKAPRLRAGCLLSLA